MSSRSDPFPLTLMGLPFALSLLPLVSVDFCIEGAARSFLPSRPTLSPGLQTCLWNTAMWITHRQTHHLPPQIHLFCGKSSRVSFLASQCPSVVLMHHSPLFLSLWTFFPLCIDPLGNPKYIGSFPLHFYKRHLKSVNCLLCNCLCAHSSWLGLGAPCRERSVLFVYVSSTLQGFVRGHRWSSLKSLSIQPSLTFVRVNLYQQPNWEFYILDLI
jgi:hypothetical protein